MASPDSTHSNVRRTSVVAAVVAAATASVITATGVAGRAAVPGQAGFGAAARIAVGQAAASLAPHSGVTGPATSR